MTDQPRKRDPIPALEWIAAAAGLLIALLMVGAIVWQGVVGSDDPVPLLSVSAVALTSGSQNHVVTVRVVNASRRTAASVQVEGKLMRGAEEVESSIATIDYVTGNGEAQGGLIFSEDPRAHAVELRVTGYEHP